jgi:hypothetical protein
MGAVILCCCDGSGFGDVGWARAGDLGDAPAILRVIRQML